jgi:RNA polymerase sigma-70 factor (ECF subfamily)
MFTIARNLCIDQGRRAKHRQVTSLDQPMQGDSHNYCLMDRVSDQGPAVDRQVISQELKGRITQALEALNKEQREVFLLREYLNLPFKEIAQIVGCSENTIKSRMRYALERLRELLEEYRDLAEAVHHY